MYGVEEKINGDQEMNVHEYCYSEQEYSNAGTSRIQDATGTRRSEYTAI
jgi:hypothetical protein